MSAATKTPLQETTPTMTLFYVDDLAGRDDASGRSPQEAWRSLERLETDEIRPGDSVLLRRGGLWRGQLRPRSGEPGKPVRYAEIGRAHV